VWFSSFIWLTTAMCGYVFSYSLMLLVRIGNLSIQKSIGEKVKFAMSSEPVAVFLVAYTFSAIWFVLGLCIFHSYLVFVNQTTNEMLRGLYEFGPSYSLGLLGNIQNWCCMIPESAVHIHHEEPVPTAELEEIQKKRVMYVDRLVDTNTCYTNETPIQTPRSQGEPSVLMCFENHKYTDSSSAEIFSTIK